MSELTFAAEPLPEEAALLFLKGQYALRYKDPRDGLQIKMLSPEAVRTAFNRIPVSSGWLPPEVRRWGYTEDGEYAVMFIPAQKHLLRLTNTWGSERFPGRRLIKVEAPLPAMVFMGLADEYRVWACAGEPGPDAPAYLAPLPNVDSSGRICYGENHPPSAAPHTLAKAWKMFMTSPFNNHMVGGASRVHPEDVREQLLAVADSRADAYPVDDLLRYERYTVDGAVNRLLKLRGGQP